MSLEGISALRKRIDRTFSQTITEKKNLLKNYDTEVDKAYNGYVKYLDSIPSQAKQIIKEKNLTEGDIRIHPFDKFFALTVYLFPLMLTENNVYRYPILKFQNENL